MRGLGTIKGDNELQSLWKTTKYVDKFLYPCQGQVMELGIKKCLKAGLYPVRQVMQGQKEAIAWDLERYPEQEGIKINFGMNSQNQPIPSEPEDE